LHQPIIFFLPFILDQFSEEEYFKAVPKIQLRQIYWDDLQEGDAVTFEVQLTEKLGLIYTLLTGNHNPIYFNKTGVIGKPVVPSELIMAFISAVGGCYLGGENVFLVKKKEAIFYAPVLFDSKLLIIKGEVMRKYRKEMKGKERYYADFKQTVYIREGENLVLVAETGALAGVLKKTRPINQQKSELKLIIHFMLPELLSQLDDQDLRKELDQSNKPKSFDAITIGDSIEVRIRVTHKMILLFALISGDYNPLHTDPRFAEDLTAFEGKNIAHGALLSAWFSGKGLLELLGWGYWLIKKEESTFQRAVKVEDEIVIKLEIRDKYKKMENKKEYYYVNVNEKLFLTRNSGQLIEAANSGSFYKSLYK